MKIRKIVSVLLIVLILICMFMTKSFAADSFSATLTPSSSRVSKGGEVTVTFKVSGINISGGLSVISAVLKYDNNVLSLDKDDVKAADKWSATYDENSSKLVFDRSDVANSDETVGTIKFKVNSSTSATTAAIQLVSIAGGNAEIDETVKISDITTNISIGSSITSSPSTSPSASNSPSPSTSTSPSTSLSPSSSITPKTSSSATPTTGNGKNTTNNGNMPDTGAENYVLPLMIFIAVLGIISFVNYKRIEK